MSNNNSLVKLKKCQYCGNMGETIRTSKPEEKNVIYAEERNRDFVIKAGMVDVCTECFCQHLEACDSQMIVIATWKQAKRFVDLVREKRAKTEYNDPAMAVAQGVA